MNGQLESKIRAEARSRDFTRKLSSAAVEIASRDRAELLRGLHPVARFAAAPFLSAILAAFAPIITRIVTELFTSFLARTRENAFKEGLAAIDSVYVAQSISPGSSDVHAFLAANPRFLDELTK